MKQSAIFRLALCACAVASLAVAASFDEQFEAIKKTATKSQMYSLMWDAPKGGDLHHHFGLSNLADQWYAAATDMKRTHGNEFYTRTRFNECPDSEEPFLRFRNIQRSTYLKLSDCAKGEYKGLAALSPKQKEEWLSSLKVDRPGEGREEFFEVIVKRVGELFRDPYLAADLLVENMKLYSAQGLRYLESMASPQNFMDQEGNRIDPEKGVQFLREALARPDAKATGMTVRFMLTVIRFAPNAEEQVERAYQFVDQHRDLWVGINMAGRGDNDRGNAARFIETFRAMRRKYSGIQLSLHGGEVGFPGPDVRDTLLLGATRIGHGLNVISDPQTMLLMRDNKYLIESNLTGGKLVEYFPDLSKHVFIEFLRFGIPVCLNTDDPGSWDTTMTDEYYTAMINFNLTWGEIVQIGRDSLRYSFVQAPEKERMLKEYAESVAKFEKKYGDANWAKHVATVKPYYSGYSTRNFQVKPD